MTPTRQRGFSLVELMVITAVVAILASLAVNSYSNYMKKANRSDATRSLLSTAQALQRCYSQNFTYQPAGGCSTPAGTVASAAGFYNVTVAIPTATTYTITATALKAPQTADSTCKTFSLTSAGVQTAQDSSGTDQTTTCWGAIN